MLVEVLGDMPLPLEPSVVRVSGALREATPSPDTIPSSTAVCVAFKASSHLSLPGFDSAGTADLDYRNTAGEPGNVLSQFHLVVSTARNGPGWCPSPSHHSAECRALKIDAGFICENGVASENNQVTERPSPKPGALSVRTCR